MLTPLGDERQQQGAMWAVPGDARVGPGRQPYNPRG